MHSILKCNSIYFQKWIIAASGVDVERTMWDGQVLEEDRTGGQVLGEDWKMGQVLNWIGHSWGYMLISKHHFILLPWLSRPFFPILKNLLFLLKFCL